MSNTTNYYRVIKDKNYTTINNEVLKRGDLSWKAKGIMAYILSLPNDWVINLDEIQSHSTDGVDSFKTGWKELTLKGYVKRYPIKEKGIIKSWNTDIYESVEPPQVEKPQVEKPQVENPQVEKPQVENPQVEKPQVEKPQVENPTLLNTNKQNTNNTKYLNKQNTNKQKTVGVEKKETILSIIEKYTANNSELYEALTGFKEMRSKKKAPLTIRAMKMALKQLNELSMDYKEQIKIVDQSTMNSWNGFYPLKNNNTSDQQKYFDLLDDWAKGGDNEQE